MAVKNTLLDLSDTLFEQLERINDASAEELEDEIRRSKAMCGIAGPSSATRTPWWTR